MELLQPALLSPFCPGSAADHSPLSTFNRYSCTIIRRLPPSAVRWIIYGQLRALHLVNVSDLNSFGKGSDMSRRQLFSRLLIVVWIFASTAVGRAQSILDNVPGD